MKHNRKVLNLLAALAVAVPMTAPLSNIDSVFAETIEFTKHDEDSSSEKLAGAVYDFYEIGMGENPDKKLFSAATKADGTLDINSVVVAKGVKNPVKDGKIDLGEGSYYAVETKAPEGYMLNTKLVNFLVENGISSIPVRASDKKFEGEYGQAVILSKCEKTGAPISGATYELSKKEGNTYKKIANLSTDNNGYFVDASDIEKMYNGTLLLPAGEYKIKELNVPGNYVLNSTEYKFNVEKGKVKSMSILHKLKNTDANAGNQTGSNTGNTGSTSNLDKTTGVKIRIIDSKDNKKALSGVAISVYSVDKNGKETLVYNGKTNSDGYLSANDAKIGGNLVSNNVLHLSPGKYYYKLSDYPNSKKHEFTVQKGKIGDQILKLNINGKSPTSNTKKSSKDSSKKLAKTGSEDTAIYAVAGVALLSAGAIVAMKKKKEVK